ncbi:serine/threonine-protein kinase [Nannocystis punicea]|uniref:Serine/threonine-protein kinase n=1 Tax=Nannocystis punicea TaxID=2995304 RepID=A0ABY7HB00_9BACT|nr:serine/threonine-protein kinase [Nannocystis poenicansa]WAS96441.1 serine/threonine-protein kinase [Nannocystis poenicansa]
MDPERPGPRPGALSDLEAKLLAAKVGGRLFQRPAEPVQLGRYRLLGRLGQGGMSVVFRAQDPQLRREVAVKLLHSPRGQPDPEQLARLRREAQALGRLSHPNVVQVFEIGEADGQSFVVMEFVRGTTLREWLRERPRAPAEVVAMISQAGRGLAAAHAAGIIHRDFKPENVLVGEDGRARVVDFGLARANPGAPADTSTGSLDAPLTKSGTVLGTPAFMAPEQLRDPGRADARSDQFSFCVMAYEALHGERPFEDLAAVAAGTLRPPPPGSTVPPALREALLRGLRVDPAERWPTMDALLAALTAGDARAASRPGRRRWLLGAGALGLIVAAVLGGRAWSAHREAQAAEQRAAALAQKLARLLAADQVEAARFALAELSDAEAGRAWADWARLLERAPGRSAREAWAHAYVFAGADAQAGREALLGLAREAVGRREDGRARAPSRRRPGHSPTGEREGAQRRVDGGTAPRDGAPPGATGPADARDGAPLRAADPTDARDGAHLGTENPATTRDGAPPPTRADRAGEAARVLALITVEAPELLAASELAPLQAAARAAVELPGRSPGEPALASRLADAAVPPEVVALARAGLLDLSAATLLTLAGRADAPTRARWQLAAAALFAADDDATRALALATAAAEEPTIRDAALAEQVALLVRDGDIEAAAEIHATRLREATLDAAARRDAEALRDRLAVLAARTRLSLRFGEGDAWTFVEPAALRRDPVGHALVVDSDAGALAAWSLELRADRLIVDVALTPASLAPDAAFAVQVLGADASAQVGLQAFGDGEGPPALALTCGSWASSQAPRPDDRHDGSEASAGPRSDASGPARDDANPSPTASAASRHDTPASPALASRVDASALVGTARADRTVPPLTLRLDLDLAGGTATCRVLDANLSTGVREAVPLRGRWPLGPVTLALQAPTTRAASPMRLHLTGVELRGASPGPARPHEPLARAGALLVDGDARAASELLADIADPRARLWQAIAAIRLGRWRDVAAPLELALAGDPALELELQRWLRDDPDGLAPALRPALGEARYLQLFARAWSHELGAASLSPAIVRRLLAELGGLDERCAGADVCAELHRAHGRALAQIGEPARARRAFEAALAVAPEDPSGRALASQLVLDLALVKAQ